MYMIQRFVVVCSVLMVLLVSGIYGIEKYTISSPTEPQVAAAVSVQTANTIINEINRVRVESDLLPLEESVALLQITEKRASDMLQRGYYAHQSPTGESFMSYLETDEYTCENLLLYPSEDPTEVVQQWLLSPQHRRCILDPRLQTASVTSVPMTDASYATGINTVSYVHVGLFSAMQNR